MSALSALVYGDNLVTLPTKLLHTLSRQGSVESFIPLAIRAILVASLLTAGRKIFRALYIRVNQKLFPTCYIASSDQAYLWIMAWIAQDPYAQSQIHDFQLCTSSERGTRRRNKNNLSSGSGSESGSGKIKMGARGTWSSNEVIGQILPTYAHSIRLRHNGNYLWIVRRATGWAGAGEHFRVKTIAFRPNVLRDFLVAAHAAYFAKEQQELLIFHANCDEFKTRINPSWQNPVSRPARPWSSVILPGDLKENLLRDVEKFLSAKDINWYASRGIPHRRGYLLHGTPGSGKTTLVTALASKLGLDIYVINPAQRGMDDAKLSKLFRDCPSKSVILIEDIDCIFPKGRNNHMLVPKEDSADSDGAEGPVEGDSEEAHEGTPAVAVVSGGKHDLAPSTVSMSGLLNAIDGVSSQEGCVLIATTNYPKRLDPALCRAGRFDVQLEFTHAIREQAKALYLHFYPIEDFGPAPRSTGDEKAVLNASGGTTVIASQAELERLADGFAAAVFSRAEESGMSGVADAKPGNEDAEPKPKPKIIDMAGDRLRSTPVSPTERAPDETPRIAMAALQAYLLQYKEDPLGAVKDAKRWAVAEGKNVSLTQPKYGLQGTRVSVVDGDDRSQGHDQGQEGAKLTSRDAVTKVLKSGKKKKVKSDKSDGNVAGPQDGAKTGE